MSLPSHDYSATKHITNNNKTNLIQQINTNNIKDLGIKKNMYLSPMGYIQRCHVALKQKGNLEP
jgi:hypothetical protein